MLLKVRKLHECTDLYVFHLPSMHSFKNQFHYHAMTGS